MTQPPKATQTVPAESAHAFLRRATERWHLRVEAAFAPFDLVTLPGLAGFLRAQAEAVDSIEAALDQADIASLLPDWPARRRAAAVKRDLETIGGGEPFIPLPRPSLGTTAHQLGAVYVLEGSRLGGKLLARRVATSADPRVLGATNFLRHEAGAGAWRHFLGVLEAAEPGRENLLEGAIEAFSMFEAAALSKR